MKRLTKNSRLPRNYIRMLHPSNSTLNQLKINRLSIKIIGLPPTIKIPTKQPPKPPKRPTIQKKKHNPPSPILERNEKKPPASDKRNARQKARSAETEYSIELWRVTFEWLQRAPKTRLGRASIDRGALARSLARAIQSSRRRGRRACCADPQ